MICRTIDRGLVQAALDEYHETLVGLNLDEWLSIDHNIALANELGDVAMFERQRHPPNSVCGHYFFHSRGKTARDAARQFLKEIFTGPYDVDVIMGLTPVEHKAAVWMTRQLGFKLYGDIDTEVGPCTFALMTKAEWLRLEGNQE